MNIEKLFSGVGMVIDDQVFNQESSDKIIRIVENLESKGFPLVKYNTIPNVSGANIAKFSFVLLDWELVSISDEDGTPIPLTSELEKSTRASLLQFLKDILKDCYLPIFIFSNSGVEDIKNKLQKNKIDVDNAPIFIKSKSDIISDGSVKVMEVIGEWIDKMPSIYVLKVWDNAVEKAKTHTFQQLSNTRYWPMAIWQTAEDDSANPNEELLDVLTQNIFERMQPISIEKEQLFKIGEIKSTKEEILNVLRAQRLEANPSKESSMTGDIYKIKGSYYLNIRPACDCVDRNKKECDKCTKEKCSGIECPHSNKVYLIKFERIKEEDVHNIFDGKYGNFIEQNNEAILGPLIDNYFYRFKFKEIKIKLYDEVKESKKGRILQPFIRHITERYALYIQRQALPRIPNQAVLDVLKESITTENQEEPW